MGYVVEQENISAEPEGHIKPSLRHRGDAIPRIPPALGVRCLPAGPHEMGRWGDGEMGRGSSLSLGVPSLLRLSPLVTGVLPFHASGASSFLLLPFLPKSHSPSIFRTFNHSYMHVPYSAY